MFPMYLKLSSELESLGISICELILGVAANLQVLSFHVHPTTTCNFCGEGKYLICRVFHKIEKISATKYFSTFLPCVQKIPEDNQDTIPNLIRTI